MLVVLSPQITFACIFHSLLQELIDAESPSHAAAELADVVFFALTAANVRGASLADADKQLDARTLRV